MIEILKYLVERLPFLFRPNGFRFVDSLASESFNNAYVVLESSSLRLRLVRDRSQLVMDFQPVGGGDEWFSVGLVRGLLSGQFRGSEVLNEESEAHNEQWVGFLETAIPEMVERFGDPDRSSDTVSALRQLSKQRAKALSPR